MDVDETFWIEEPVIPEQKRSQRTYMEEFIPRIGPYLHCLLNSEGVPVMTTCQSCMSAPFEWRCTECFPTLVLCKECCRKSHQRLPFHRVQRWTGKYFILSWMWESQMDCDNEDHQLPTLASATQNLATVTKKETKSLLSSIGLVFMRSASAGAAALKLPSMTSTFHNPKTVFTFRVLEDFHLDNLECKTTPSQFFSHLRRLTNDEFPNTVLIGESTKIGFMMDGNFQAEHMKMRNPENDIPLSEGTAFMVSQKPYESHLKSVVERQQRSSCHNHRAVNNVNKHSRHLESTGIGAVACIHGAFVPDSVIDFQREKREFSYLSKYASQKNMDYSIFKALNFNMEGIEAALISYDVMCQWSVHMMERVASSNFLKLPDNLELRYSPSFIEGGRQIDGETIETLWAPLNEITRSTRGMSTSHRREVIDDHMNDSNWKKLIDLGKFLPMDAASVLTLVVCYQKALLAATLSAAAFESISVSASPERVQAWDAEEEHTQREQSRDVKVMDIYDIKMKQCYPFKHCVRGFKKDLMRSRSRQLTFSRHPHNSGDDFWDNTPLREAYIGIEFDGIGNHSTDSSIDVEYIPLHLPSHLGHDWCDKNGAEDLAKAELHLREGQLNDSLHHLRIALRHKSYLFRHDVYTRAQQAMVDLGTSSSLLDHRTHHCLGFGQWTFGEMPTLGNGWKTAKAQKMWWIEELQCLQVEMESAVRFFKHQEQSWQAKQELIEPQSQPGHAAWAARQSTMWSSMAIQAGSKFTTLLKSSPEFAKVLLQPKTSR
ncbi:hypothetical protein EDB92DRAFT_1815425 [Lactarius akahatsu]|uniref:CxC2-like cysteine cluster KDZ transposase-associated domain-containing protein n=1 Tax=Lactarius akahatsu TaxID=416441 RepID=A0AAD4LIX4_9AGAM|nr:hypothetical protein EDB92DRAFT_1815425 [Lactarius akahatsu]